VRAPPSPVLSRRAALALFLFFQVWGFVVYAPALLGPPISDDFVFFLNPYVQHPTPENLLAILDPRSLATLSLVNYAPGRALLHALLWKIAPQNVLLYHSLNVVFHGVASFFLVRFLITLGVPVLAGSLAGLFFLVHPANVEAVAWMSQVWSPLALVFSLLALRWLDARPALATAAFVLAMLTKPVAVFALPVAAVLEWLRGVEARRPGPPAHAPSPDASRWPWILGWTVLAGLYMTAQIFTFLDSSQITQAPLPIALRLRFVAVVALRYLLMAATSYGVSVAQQPPLPRSWLDPWWLASLPVLALLGFRFVRTLRERTPEAAAWMFALAGFAPVSQIFPFLYPLADRYLYFILPGLLAAVLLWGRAALGRATDAARRRRIEGVLLASSVVLCALFSQRSLERARIWKSEDLQVREAARNFPDGISAHLQRALERGEAGDADGEMAELRAAGERGFVFTSTALVHPSFRRLRDDPRYRPLLRTMIGRTLELIARKPRESQSDLREVAICHELLGEIPEALNAVTRGLALGGPLDGSLRSDRERLERLAHAKPPAEAEAQ